jgi:hypothetical protein
MDHLEVIAVMALVPLGAWVAMGQGMVLEWWAKFWGRMREENYPGWNEELDGRTNVFPAWIRKPIYECPRCMVSAWGIPAALLTFPDLNLWLLPVYLLAACGLQEAIHR